MMRRSLRNAAGVAVALCVAVSLFGCSASSTPPPPDPTEAEILDAMTAYVEQNVEGREAEYPEVWENIRFERFIKEIEAPEVLGGCVAEFGVTTATFNGDGSASWSDLPNSNYVSNVVDACSLKYPYDFLRTFVHSDAQNEYLYDYGVNFVLPCLSAAGVDLEAPPRRDQYMENAQQGLYSWSPYNSADFGTWLGGVDETGQYPSEEILEYAQLRCPIFPAGMEPDY
jgi:hypothetical protein